MSLYVSFETKFIRTTWSEPELRQQGLGHKTACLLMDDQLNLELLTAATLRFIIGAEML